MRISVGMMILLHGTDTNSATDTVTITGTGSRRPTDSTRRGCSTKGGFNTSSGSSGNESYKWSVTAGVCAKRIITVSGTTMTTGGDAVDGLATM